MNKRQLVAKIDELIDTVNRLNRKILSLKRENDELKAALTLLENNSLPKPEVKKEVVSQPHNADCGGFVVRTEEFSDAEEVANSEETVTEETVTEETVAEPVILKDDVMEYGSQIIGKIIVESAKYANAVSSAESENKKELVNLIMGKAEVTKAEIFNISTSEIGEENKKEMIDAQLKEATDYFKSVAAQL